MNKTLFHLENETMLNLVRKKEFFGNFSINGLKITFILLNTNDSE